MKMHMPAYCLAAALAASFLFSLMALAIEPTTIEPAESLIPKTFEIEQGVRYLHLDRDEVEAETEVTYGLNKYLDLGISVPFVFEEGHNAEIEDVAIFLEGVFNPDSDSTRVGGELQLKFPTGEDSDGMGGEAQLRITHPFDPGQKHQLHLNLTGFYDDVEKEHHHHWRHSKDYTDTEFRFGAALGYSVNITEATTLIAALSHEQDYDESNDANLVELGIAHNFSPACTVGLGVGTGLDSDSPDLEARAVLQLRFGSGK